MIDLGGLDIWAAVMLLWIGMLQLDLRSHYRFKDTPHAAGRLAATAASWTLALALVA